MKGEEKSMNLRSKSQKRQGAWKKVVSMFLALCMVVTMLPVTQMTANAAEQVTIKTHFKNTEGWKEVGFYSWSDGVSTGGWPGVKVQENQEHPGYFTYEVTKAKAGVRQ